VSGFGGEIRIASTTEHAQCSMEGKVWAGRADRFSGEVVQQICGVVEPFYLVASRNRSLTK
jgi:hypothetical protein